MNHQLDHLWHVWINQRQEDRRAQGQPWESHLYAFKNMLHALPWMGQRLQEAFTGTLPMRHQQCSHSPIEALPENHLTCALGQEVTSCPILRSLRLHFEHERQRTLPNRESSWYAEITDEQIYQVMGATCAWHLLMSDVARTPQALPTPAFVDWAEGALQDASDRVYWARVYEGLAQAETMEEEP